MPDPNTQTNKEYIRSTNITIFVTMQQGAIISTICILIAFVVYWIFSPIHRAQHKSTSNTIDSIERSYKDSFNILKRQIALNKDSILTLERTKYIIRQKYDTLYRNLDSATFDEILFEYAIFDDTTVTHEGSNLIKFRLVQGIEAIAMNQVINSQLEQYAQMTERLINASIRDSVIITTLIAENRVTMAKNDELTGKLIQYEQRKGKQVGYIALSGIVGIFSGLVLKR